MFGKRRSLASGAHWARDDKCLNPQNFTNGVPGSRSLRDLLIAAPGQQGQGNRFGRNQHIGYGNEFVGAVRLRQVTGPKDDAGDALGGVPG